MAKIFLPDRDVLISDHAEQRIASRNVTHQEVKETMMDADTRSGNPQFEGGFNYWKTFENKKIRVSTMIEDGTEIVVTVSVYEKGN